MKKIFLALILLSISSPAIAEWRVFTYDPPTEREDGQPFPKSELKGYKVYVDGYEYIRSIFIQNILGGNFFAKWFGFVMVDIPIDTKTLYITAVDTDGRQSRYSNNAITNR